MPAPSSIPPATPPPPIARRNFIARVAAFVAGGAVLGRTAKAADAPPVRTLDGDPWVGEIALVPYNFAPTGWAVCDGQLMSIAQNTALFSLLGTTYGGDGQTTFALPDLRGRVPIHQGQGPGLSPRTLGEGGGEENHTLGIPELPSHSHAAQASSANGTSDSPVGGVPARNAAGTPGYAAAPNAAQAATAIAAAGGGQAHNNMPPYLAMTYIISLFGIYPSRS
jgi:microcystin-dependent protein